MPMTYNQANKILDFNFGQTSYALPPKYYIGLSSTPINADGTNCTEPWVNNYARFAIDNSKTPAQGFSISQQGSLSNLIEIRFPESTGDWGIMTHVAIFDAAVNGNLLYYDILDYPRKVEIQTTVIFTPGSLIIQLK